MSYIAQLLNSLGWLMIHRFAQLLSGSSSRPVFVIGTGRSGTHWLGYSLGDHPEVRATVEAQPMFRLSTTIALNASLESRLLGMLVLAYRWQLLRSGSSVYLDKSHPNIWIAEKLKAAFPTALFVGIERNPYATVASMMRHVGVSAWHKRWREFPIPNRFLGISAETAKEYDSISLPSKCALRWVAHHERMNELKGILGDDLFAITYDGFAHDTTGVLRHLQEFMGLKQPIPIPEVKTESLHKWESQLSSEEIGQIRDVVGFDPRAVAH